MKDERLGIWVCEASDMSFGCLEAVIHTFILSSVCCQVLAPHKRTCRFIEFHPMPLCIGLSFRLGVATHYSVSLIKWSLISSLFSRAAIPHFTHVPQHDSWHTQSYPYLPLITSDVRHKLKYTINHPRTHSDFRSRDSSISVA